MRILILGGTVFLGRHLTEMARADGHEVTLFTRGLHGTELLRGVRHLRGDRGGDLSALEGHEWDLAVDTSGFVPRDVLRSSRILSEAVPHYVYVSTASVYRDWPAAPVDELAPVWECPPDANEDFGHYGVLKAGCERAVAECFGERSLIARVGLLVGPHDNIFRLPWWVERIARGGQVLAPAPPARDLQMIDARDLAAWLLTAGRERLAGVFNATGPRGHTTFAELLGAMVTSTGSAASLEWVDDEFLVGEGVAPWTELPLWMPEADGAGTWRMATDRAAGAGLTARSAAATVADVCDWMRSGASDLSEGYRSELRPAGLSAEREAELLARWRTRRT